MKVIDFYLRENHLSTSEENLYMASVKKKKTIEQDELVEIMLGKNTTVTRQDMIVVLDLLKETVMEQVLSGFPVKTNLFKAGVSIRGGFTSSADEYDSAKHLVCVNMNPVNEFKKEVAYKASVAQVLPSTNSPFIRQVFDYDSQEFREDLMAGSLIGLRGAYFSDDNRTTQVYLNLDGSDERVPAGKLHQVKDRNILCSLPEDLTPGSYWLTVILGEGNQATQGSYNKLITVS